MNNFILDPDFQAGAQIYSPGKPMTFTGNLAFTEEAPNPPVQRPSWLLTQWNSRNSIRTVKGERRDGAFVYENAFKKVALADDGTLTLRLNGGKEYLQPRKVKMEPWVHLYFEQRYAEPYPLKGIEKMKLRMSFSIPYFKDCTPGGNPDPTVNASIAVFYIILKDVNPQSPAYDQFINFCVMLYDNRTEVTPESWFMDAGQNPIDATNMLIYTMDSSVYTGPVAADGAWHEIDFDPLPYFQKAFQIAQESNCMNGSKWEDIAVSSTFFGFETTGMMDNELQIRAPFLGPVDGNG